MATSVPLKSFTGAYSDEWWLLDPEGPVPGPGPGLALALEVGEGVDVAVTEGDTEEACDGTPAAPVVGGVLRLTGCMLGCGPSGTHIPDRRRAVYRGKSEEVVRNVKSQKSRHFTLHSRALYSLFSSPKTSTLPATPNPKPPTHAPNHTRHLRPNNRPRQRCAVRAPHLQGSAALQSSAHNRLIQR